MRLAALTRLVTGGAVVGAVAWTAGEAWPERRLPVAAPIIVTQAYRERADTLGRNETLSHLFARHDVVGDDLVRLLAAADGLDPRRVPAGQVLELRYPVGVPRPDRVTVRLGDDRLLTVARDSAAGWHGTLREIAWSVETRRVVGQIRSSLYETVHELIPDSVLPPQERVLLVWDLADGVFGWVVDFSRDNYEGDAFQLLYERLTSALGDVRYGRIVAAKIETRGVENTAYVISDARGSNAYYDEQGRSLRRAFKLYPVEFRRISSGFSRRRYHPILKRHRPHLGVDYAARPGTEIRATGDGMVTRAGRWGGYGIMVSIRHPKDIETRYAHMSRLERGIRRGVRVQQGQRIGFVGATGLATSPHVHYEFLKNGRHVDPRSAVKVGEGEPVPEERQTEFQAIRAYYDRLLSSPTVRTAAARTH